MTRWFQKRAHLLPEYVNGTLNATGRRAVERRLRHSPEARAALVGWKTLHEAVAGQAQKTPPPAVWLRIAARVRTVPAARRQPVPWSRLALGGALAATIVALLWCLTQPGIVLQWSADDGPFAAFRVYRAPLGSTEFRLVHQVTAQPEQQRYTYVDVRLWPGRTYVYRVEGLGREGRPTSSRAITASALEALPGQIAILLTGLILTYAAAQLLPPEVVPRRT